MQDELTGCLLGRERPLGGRRAPGRTRAGRGSDWARFRMVWGYYGIRAHRDHPTCHLASAQGGLTTDVETFPARLDVHRLQSVTGRGAEPTLGSRIVAAKLIAFLGRHLVCSAGTCKDRFARVGRKKHALAKVAVQIM